MTLTHGAGPSQSQYLGTLFPTSQSAPSISVFVLLIATQHMHMLYRKLDSEVEPESNPSVTLVLRGVSETKIHTSFTFLYCWYNPGYIDNLFWYVFICLCLPSILSPAPKLWDLCHSRKIRLCSKSRSSALCQGVSCKPHRICCLSH